MTPSLSSHFSSRQPSAIRLAQIEFLKRSDQVTALNTAIGNVRLPMHPAMQERMFNLQAPTSPFKDGVVQYSTTVGDTEANKAVLTIIASSGHDTNGLHSQITDGGSQAMELVILGVGGQPGSQEKPLLLIDPAYSNYASMAERTGRATVALARTLQNDGNFSLPSIAEIEDCIIHHQPGALVIIPYDNPTGQFMDQATINELAALCVKHGIWLISDEAYRELAYTNQPASSVWGVTETAVPGITGHRISIESASKIWNACGLRIGAIVTDSQPFHEKAVAENTANLCANVIGQYIFGALAHETPAALQTWYQNQRDYYSALAKELTSNLKAALPELIVSKPDASLYTVVDVKNLVAENFNATDFVLYCAQQGKVLIDGKPFTLLVAPMAGFYAKQPSNDLQKHPGSTQMRIAYVESPENMRQVPTIFSQLLAAYEQNRRQL